MKCLYAIGIAIFLSCLGEIRAESAEKCLSLDPTVVELTGTLISKTYPGPPNYESIKQGDEPEAYWFLELRPSVCVDFGGIKGFQGVREREIGRVQLTFRSANAERTAEHLRGERITVTGSLLQGSTQDHNALVLLWVTDVKADCRQYFPYEPEVVELTGVIVSRTYPGPPNYESIRKGDEPETYWLLVLSTPICVAQKSPEDVYPAKKNIYRIQLVFDGEKAYATYRRLLGRRVIATGTLYSADNIHHKTPVLLTIASLKRAK